MRTICEHSGMEWDAKEKQEDWGVWIKEDKSIHPIKVGQWTQPIDYLDESLHRL